MPPPFELSCSFFTPPTVDQPHVVALGSPIPMVRVTPMSFSPQTGLIYAQGRGHVGLAKRFEDPWISDNRPAGYLRLGLPESTGVLAAVDPRTNTVTWKQELVGGRLATSGPMSTAGGLVFWGSADGQLDAYDAATGERLWAFQAAPAGLRMRPGPASTYAIDGRQYVALPMGSELWAFALDGELPPRDEPVADPPDLVRWTGPAPTETDEIQTGTLRENPSWSLGGSRSALDEHAFNPQRARVSAGTRVRFVNNGSVAHHRGAGRELDHRRHRAGAIPVRRLRVSRDVPVPLHRPPLGAGRDHGRAVRRRGCRAGGARHMPHTVTGAWPGPAGASRRNSFSSHVRSGARSKTMR